jgi:hypothetical protein
MPNKLSPNSFRMNFIAPKVLRDGLVERARKEGVSQGGLIRAALEKTYPEIPTAPVLKILTPKGNSIEVTEEQLKIINAILELGKKPSP